MSVNQRKSNAERTDVNKVWDLGKEIMTRAEAKTKLVALGIAEPTEEQVTNYLDSISDATKAEKARADRYKEKADKADELQTKVDELESGNLSEIEKANKALETANAEIAKLKQEQELANSRKNAMEQFKITSEQANKVVKDDGTFDYAELGKIISEKETAAANAKEQEIARNANNPGGGSAGSGDDKKTNAEKIAESIGKNFAESSKSAKSVVDSYL